MKYLQHCQSRREPDFGFMRLRGVFVPDGGNHGAGDFFRESRAKTEQRCVGVLGVLGWEKGLHSLK